MPSPFCNTSSYLGRREVKYPFRDAVTLCLYDEAIYPTSTTAVLLDETDERITFASDADERVFESIHDRLVDLAQEP
jgi:hypothetical protein